MTFRNTAIKNNMTLTKLQLKKVIPVRISFVSCLAEQTYQ